MQSTVNSATEIAKLNEKFDGLEKERLFSYTLLGFPMDVDSGRNIMFSSNTKQIMTLENPDIPHVLSGYENAFGKFSGAFKQLKGDWEVKQKIEKFSTVYSLVLYNKATDTYDIIERKEGEPLTEKFAFMYNNEKMDSLKVGDMITGNAILYKSTSYDDNMNYRLGKEALVMYKSSTATIEDAVKIRRGFADQFVSSSIEPVEVSINNNDILLFMHGNEKDGYRTLPRIGERLHDVTLCATRRINNNRILYDLQLSQLTEMMSTDMQYVVNKNAYVYDIDVFYNNTDEPFPDNVFFNELKGYYEICCKYADELLQATTAIKNSGSKYTKNVTRVRSYVKNFNDPEYKWKSSKDTTFSNMVVKFMVASHKTITEGAKCVGRYGDKGVVSKITDIYKEHGETPIMSADGTKTIQDLIQEKMGLEIPDNIQVSVVEDEYMPYLEDGTRIDMELNASGAFRRLNTGQIFEVEINFIGERIRQHICTMDNLDDKIDLALKFIGMLNSYEAETYLNFLKNPSSVDKEKLVNIKTEDGKVINTLKLKSDRVKAFKEAFIRSIEKHGFYILKPPSVSIRYDEIKAIYDEFPGILEPYQLYVDKFGRKKIPVMKKAVVGHKYMYALKQTTAKNFSARSTGRTNRAGIPAKSSEKKDNRITDSNSPIRIGETHNLFSQISGMTLATLNIFTRTSAKGRLALGEVFKNETNPMMLKDLKVEKTYVNANVQMLKARLKVMGIGYDIITDRTITEEKLNTMKTFIVIYDMTFFDTPLNRKYYARIIDMYYKLVRMGYAEKCEDTWNAVLTRPEITLIDPPDNIVELVKEAIQDNPNSPLLTTSWAIRR